MCWCHFRHPRWLWHRQPRKGDNALGERHTDSALAEKTHDITTELNKAFAAARVNALMGGVDLGDTIDPLSTLHKALKAAHASGELPTSNTQRRPAYFW